MVHEERITEEFRIIDFFGIKEDMYAVSNFGRVKNIKTGRILSQVMGNWYWDVGLQTKDMCLLTIISKRLKRLTIMNNMPTQYANYYKRGNLQKK